MLYDKICDCGTKFISQGPAGKYCDSCRAIVQQRRKDLNRVRAEIRRREAGCRVGRGAPRGVKHPNYKHGLYVAQTQSREYREKIRYCERCKVDTLKLTRWHWVMHHKDHNHANHDDSNLELLCKSCHAKEHGAHKHLLESATTIRKE